MPASPHTRVRIVQSRQNARVKELRAALARPSAALIGLEGLHLVEEALRSHLSVQTIFVGEQSAALLDALDTAQLARIPEILSVSEDVLRSAVSTQAPQAIAALAVPPSFTLEQLFDRPANTAGDLRSLVHAPLLLVLAGLQDPGNVGTILRSAEAFAARGVLSLPGTANVWNAKSLRASMGSAFRLPVIGVSAAQAFELLHAHGILSLAAVAPGLAGAESLGSPDLRVPVALWIGSEGSGLTRDLIDGCDAAVTIPLPGPVESLNAAIAASVLLYEASRQRAESPRRQAHPGPE
jgi:TrmH family RNA methyltransferase